jgi:hypothetical protein
MGHGLGQETEETAAVWVSPPSLRTPRLGAQGTGTQVQWAEAVSGGHSDLPACLLPSTAAAGQMLCPGGRTGICER